MSLSISYWQNLKGTKNLKMNLLQLKRIIQLTNGEADIETHEKVFLLDWMMTYKENQAKCGKKDGDQIWVTIRILKNFAGEQATMDQIDKTFCLFVCHSIIDSTSDNLIAFACWLCDNPSDGECRSEYLDSRYKFRGHIANQNQNSFSKRLM